MTLFGCCMLAVPLWALQDMPYSPPLVLLGLGLMFFGIVSGLGFGPLGRARDRALATEEGSDADRPNPRNDAV